MTETPSSPHLSRPALARLLLAGAVAPDSGHLSGCERCQRALAEARADEQRFRATVMPRTLPNVESGRARGTPWSLTRWLATGSAGAVALAALVLVVVGRGAGDPAIGVKGGPSLKVYALADGAVTAVRDGTRLRRGDRLRFTAVSSERYFVSVGSVDGRRETSVLYTNVIVAAGRVTTLPDSVELDDAPGFERIYALFSKQPIAADELGQALAAAARAAPPGGPSGPSLPLAHFQVSLLIEKEAAR